MIQNALLSTSCAAKPFLAVFRHELQYKNTNFMSMTLHTALYKRRGGEGRKKLFKLQEDNFNSFIARAPSVRYPANHRQHTLGTRSFLSRATGSFVSSAEGRRHKRDRKPRLKSLWHPGYSPSEKKRETTTGNTSAIRKLTPHKQTKNNKTMQTK